MPRYVTPSGVEIEMSEQAASRVGYAPVGETEPKTRKPRTAKTEE
jgi:hypothetical protein